MRSSLLLATVVTVGSATSGALGNGLVADQCYELDSARCCEATSDFYVNCGLGPCRGIAVQNANFIAVKKAAAGVAGFKGSDLSQGAIITCEFYPPYCGEDPLDPCQVDMTVTEFRFCQSWYATVGNTNCFGTPLVED